MRGGLSVGARPGSGADHIRSSRFFPNATSYGIDASASVAVKLTGSIGARAGADFRQYGIALHPDSTTRAVAGAVDRYIVAWAGLEVVLDGQGGAAGGDDEPAKPSKRRRRHAEPKPDDGIERSSSSKSDAVSGGGLVPLPGPARCHSDAIGVYRALGRVSPRLSGRLLRRGKLLGVEGRAALGRATSRAAEDQPILPYSKKAMTRP